MQPVLGAKHVFIAAVSVLAVVQGATHHHQWDLSPSFQSLTPPIRASQGDTVVVTIRSTNLGENVAIRWDEQIIATARADETTEESIPPGGTITYEFVVDRPGTFAYHVYHGGESAATLHGMIVVDAPMGEMTEPSASCCNMPQSRDGYAAVNGDDVQWSDGGPSNHGRSPSLCTIGKTGHPSIHAVAMAGGTVYWSDKEEDGMPPEHLLVASMDDVDRPLMFAGLRPTRLDEDPSVILEGMEPDNQQDTYQRIIRWAKAVGAASSFHGVHRPRDP